LRGFCEKAREYGITTVHTLASTALREASNQAYILDHLFTRNKLNVQVLEDTEVSSLMISAAKSSSYVPIENTLFVAGGTGTIDFELLKNEKIVLAHSIQTGLLKISEMLREASEFSRRIDILTEEYLYTFLTRENRIQDLWNADEIVFSSGDMQPLYKLCGIKADAGAVKIQRETVLDIYQSHRSLSVSQICERYEIDVQQGGSLYAMLTLLDALLRLTNAKKLFCIQTNIADAMQTLLLKPGARKKHYDRMREGAIASALDLAARYRCDLNHCRYVAGSALYLFEKLRKPLGFSKEQGLLLNIACILHQSGQYTNAADLYGASYNLVKEAHIYGLRSYDTLQIANIIVPQSLPGVVRSMTHGVAPDGEDVLSAAKMHSIYRLADALDYSHEQKARIHDAVFEDGSLIISVQIHKDFTLEQWMFKESASLFREIFGITPQLKINNIYYS
ncbi:MAG: hypothetical protein LBH28_10530, partial [Oscillospiraceae bacterium]|nr:hypothetical protein [Oscillospiraceae bacterium]